MNYPHAGVLGSKPRLSPPEGNGSSSKEEFARLSREYLEIRNRTQSAKAYLAEVQASRARGALLDRKWVYDTTAYVVTCFRQRVLLSPRTFTSRLVQKGLVDAANEHGVLMALDAGVRELLTELAHLELKATDPGWLKTLERENVGTDDKSERPSTPKELLREQARATHRRQKQTEAKRRQRQAV
jgi:hypothetical protein